MTRTTRIRHAASVLALAAALGACTTVGPDFARPAAPGAPGYAAAGEAAPGQQQVAVGEAVAGKWWDYFGSSDLDQVIRLAVQNSPSLQAADATLQAALIDIRAVRAESAPQLTANGGVTGNRANLASFGFDPTKFAGISNNPEFVLYSVGGTVSYAIDPFGLNKREVESAEAKAEVQARQVDAAYLSLTGNVALQAAQIAAVRAQIAAVEAILVQDRRTIDLVQKAEAAGGEAEGARVNAQAQLAADTARLPPMRQDLAAARHALAVLVGKAPADWSPPDFDLARLTLPNRIPVSLPSELVRQRPDILAAEARLHAATADVGVATAELYPSLNLSATLTQSALSIPSLFSYSATGGNLGGQLVAPLLDGGRRKARREAARATARAALATYQSTVVQAFGQVADLMQALAHDEEALAAQDRSRTLAQRSLALSQSAYDGGAIGLLPVVDAQRQVNDAELAYVRIQAQRYMHTVQLFVATGSGLRDTAAPAPKA